MTRNELNPQAGEPASGGRPEGSPVGEVENSVSYAASTQPAPRMVTRVSAALAVVLLICLFLSRSFAQRFDFGVANVLTLVMGFFAWLSLTIAFASSRLPRWYWRSVALVPVLAIGIALIFVRVVRLDGELVPQFESRWKTVSALPKGSPSDQRGNISDSQLAPRDTDFTQFLGNQRNAVVTGVRLETDWETRPPKILWKQPIGAGWSGFAIQGDVAVTLEQREQEQWVSAYEVETGELLWHTGVPGYHFNVLGGAGPRSTPTISVGRVYAHMATGQLVCLELQTGERVWEADLFKIAGWDQESAEAAVAWGRSGSPLIIKDMVVVPLGGPIDKDRSLIAFSAQDGRTLWRAGSDQISYSSPSLVTLLGVEQIVIVNETTVTGHAIEDGQVLWTVDWPGQSNGPANVSQTTPIGDSRLLISKGYSQGAQLVEFTKDAQGKWKHEIVWKDPSVLKTKFTSPVVRGEYAYGLSDGILECVKLSNGERQWKKGRYRQGQLLLVDDILLITSESGSIVLVAADPKEFKELAKQDVIGDVTWNTPALSGNRLLIRNAEEAACVSLPLAEGQ